jgi:hypothetical protein
MSSKVATRSGITVSSGPSPTIRPESVARLLGDRTDPGVDDKDKLGGGYDDKLGVGYDDKLCIGYEDEADYGDMREAVGVFGVVLACGAAWAAAAALWWLF